MKVVHDNTVVATNRVMGLDMSLQATGVACASCGPRTVSFPKLRGEERLVQIRQDVMSCGYFHDVVVLEGYSFGSHQAHSHALGELGGVVRVALHEAGIPFAEVAPAALKKFATGKGNATKDQVLAAAIRRFGFEGDNNNAADAHILRAMGLAHYFHDFDTYGQLPQDHLEALAKVEWPEMRLLSTGAGAHG